MTRLRLCSTVRATGPAEAVPQVSSAVRRSGRLWPASTAIGAHAPGQAHAGPGPRVCVVELEVELEGHELQDLFEAVEAFDARLDSSTVTRVKTFLGAIR